MEGGAVGHNFVRDPPRDHPCQVWFNLVQRFQRRRFKCDLLSKYAWPGELKNGVDLLCLSRSTERWLELRPLVFMVTYSLLLLLLSTSLGSKGSNKYNKMTSETLFLRLPLET